MKFRMARHTQRLAPVIDFYQSVVGLKVLGSFDDHEGYNGVFLGLPDLPWHIEFTESSDSPDHLPDPDDLLVFYAPDQQQYDDWLRRIESSGTSRLTAKNPYWHGHAVTIADPDGYRIVLVSPPQG